MRRPIFPGPLEIARDATPWDWGALLLNHGRSRAWAAGRWGDAIARRFHAYFRGMVFQTLWERRRVVRIDPLGRRRRPPLPLAGRQLGGAQQFCYFVRSGPALMRHASDGVAEAARQWALLANLRPPDCSDVADAFSRLECPTAEAKSFPAVLADVRRSQLPA